MKYVSLHYDIVYEATVQQIIYIFRKSFGKVNNYRSPH